MWFRTSSILFLARQSCTRWLWRQSNHCTVGSALVNLASRLGYRVRPSWPKVRSCVSQELILDGAGHPAPCLHPCSSVLSSNFFDQAVQLASPSYTVLLIDHCAEPAKLSWTRTAATRAPLKLILRGWQHTTHWAMGLFSWSCKSRWSTLHPCIEMLLDWALCSLKCQRNSEKTKLTKPELETKSSKWTKKGTRNFIARALWRMWLPARCMVWALKQDYQEKWWP